MSFAQRSGSGDSLGFLLSMGFTSLYIHSALFV